MMELDYQSLNYYGNMAIICNSKIFITFLVLIRLLQNIYSKKQSINLRCFPTERELLQSPVNCAL